MLIKTPCPRRLPCNSSQATRRSECHKNCTQLCTQTLEKHASQQSVKVTGERRFTPLQVLGERPNCRQSEIACHIAILAGVLQIVEEAHDVLCREISDRDALGLDSMLLLQISQEDAQCITGRTAW